MTQLRIPTLDYDSTPTVDEIENAIAFIKTFREKQQSVYVHCKAGRGRSAFLVVCYLVKVICVVLVLSQCYLIKCFLCSRQLHWLLTRVKPTVHEFI